MRSLWLWLGCEPMSAPVRLWQVLNEDQEQLLGEVAEQLSRLAAKVVLAHLAVCRRGDRPITEIRLDALSASLREAVEDARAAQRAAVTRR